MDDLLKGLVAMPDLIARKRQTLPDSGQEGAFMVAFTRLDVLPVIPMIDQGDALAEIVAAMPQSLPGMVSMEHLSMPKPSAPLPDASAAVSLVVPASNAAIAHAQDTPIPDDVAPLVAVAWLPLSDPTMHAPDAPDAAEVSENTPLGQAGPASSVFEQAVTGPVMPKVRSASQPIAPAPLTQLVGGETPIAPASPAPMAMFMDEPPDLVPPPRDAPKAARLAVADLVSPPKAPLKPPMAHASPPVAIMPGQGNDLWSPVPTGYPMAGDLIQVLGDPPPLSDHLPLPKSAVAALMPAQGLPPSLSKSAVMVAPSQAVVTTGPSDVAAPAPSGIAPDHAPAPPVPFPHMQAAVPQPIAMPMAHASVPDMPIAAMGPQPAPSSRAVADLAPTQPQPMIPPTPPPPPTPPRDQQTALPKPVESSVVTTTTAQAWGGAAIPANVAIPAPMQPAAPLPQTQAAQIPMALPQGMPPDSVARVLGSPSRDMRIMGDPSDASLSLAHGAAPALAARIGPGTPDLPMLAQSASQQIVSASAQLLAEPGGPIDIALDPPELGRVRLSLVEVNGVITLSITAERPETADLMRRHLSLLADEFARQGLDAPSVDISGGGQGGRQPRDDDQRRAPEGHDHPINRPIGPIIGTSLQVAASGLDLRL